jgi:hypothetical protein
MEALGHRLAYLTWRGKKMDGYAEWFGENHVPCDATRVLLRRRDRMGRDHFREVANLLFAAGKIDVSDNEGGRS